MDSELRHEEEKLPNCQIALSARLLPTPQENYPLVVWLNYLIKVPPPFDANNFGLLAQLQLHQTSRPPDAPMEAEMSSPVGAREVNRLERRQEGAQRSGRPFLPACLSD